MNPRVRFGKGARLLGAHLRHYASSARRLKPDIPRLTLRVRSHSPWREMLGRSFMNHLLIDLCDPLNRNAISLLNRKWMLSWLKFNVWPDAVIA
jgi:hypothetical protein